MFHKKKQEDEFEMVNLKTVYGVYEREALTGLLEETISRIYSPEKQYRRISHDRGRNLPASFWGNRYPGWKNVYEKAKELMDSVNWDGLEKETEIPEEEWNIGEPPEE